MTPRPRGVALTRLDFRPLISAVRERHAIPADAVLSLDYTYALALALARAHDRTYVLCHEGVGWT